MDCVKKSGDADVADIDGCYNSLKPRFHVEADAKADADADIKAGTDADDVLKAETDILIDIFYQSD